MDEGGKGDGKKVLWENIWDSLDLDDLHESEKKLGKKVHDGIESGDEGGGGDERVLWESIWDSLDMDDSLESEEKLRKKLEDEKGSGGEGQGGGGEWELWENMWDSLDLDNSPKSKEKLENKVVDGKESGGEGGGGSEKVLRENMWNSLDLDDLFGSEEKLGNEVKAGKESGGEGEEGAAPPTKKRDHEKGKESVGEEGEEAAPPTKKRSHKKGKESVEEGEGAAPPTNILDPKIQKYTRQDAYKKYRDKLKSVFANLLAMLLEPRAEKVKSKAAVMVEAKKDIQTLQCTLWSLETRKLERVQGGFGPSIITSQKLSYNSREAFLVDQGSLNNLAITKTSSSNSPSLLQYPVVFQTWIFSNVVLNICGNEAQISIYSAKKPGLLTTIWCALEKHKTKVVSAHIVSDCNRGIYMIQAHVTGGSVLGIEIYKQAAKEIMLCFSP